MNDRSRFQDSIDYIETNLKATLTARELADRAGFSFYHYCRLFQSATGLPVMRYITRRRLLHALYAASRGEKLVDAALQYGFDTHAGFYKAFRREFGCSPSAYLKNRRVKRPGRVNLFQEEIVMLSHKTIREVLRHWGIENEPITDIYYAGSGERNDHAFCIGGEYVLKFTSDFDRLCRHQALSRAVTEKGLFADSFIQTREGGDYLESGGLYFYLARRLPGAALIPSSFYGEAGLARAQLLGEGIGRLHAALEEQSLPLHESSLYEKAFGWALSEMTDILPLPEGLLQESRENFGRLYAALPRQAIHRDLNPGNLLLDGCRWCFIDFEQAGRDIRIFDPCYAATAILSETFRENDCGHFLEWVKIYQGILRGYDGVARLSAEERRAAPYVVLSNQLVCCAWLRKQDRYQEIYETNLRMTRLICDRFDSLRL